MQSLRTLQQPILGENVWGEERKINLPKIVAYLSCSAGRTHVSDQNKMNCVKIDKDDIQERGDGLVYAALSFRNH